MSKHTPGKWEIAMVGYPKDDCFAVVANKGKTGIALVGKVDVKKEERIANMFLIAAAPELLEACKAVVERASEIGYRHKPSPIVAKCKQAIATAEAK